MARVVVKPSYVTKKISENVFSNLQGLLKMTIKIVLILIFNANTLLDDVETAVWGR